MPVCCDYRCLCVCCVMHSGISIMFLFCVLIYIQGTSMYGMRHTWHVRTCPAGLAARWQAGGRPWMPRPKRRAAREEASSWAPPLTTRPEGQVQCGVCVE